MPLVALICKLVLHVMILLQLAVKSSFLKTLKPLDSTIVGCQEEVYGAYSVKRLVKCMWRS